MLRRLRTFPVGKLRHTPAALGTENMLQMIFGVLGSGGWRRRQFLPRDDLHHFVAVQDLALEQRLGDADQRVGVLLMISVAVS